MNFFIKYLLRFLDSIFFLLLKLLSNNLKSINIVININVGYPGSGFAYFPLEFAHKGDQNRIKRDQDRTRRALSNALFTFPMTPPQAQEKSKILSKNNEKTLHI